MKVALMGTRGAPATYGGFETAVEEIGSRLADRGHQVVVYCRNPGQTTLAYRGMKLVNLPAIRHRMGETLSHTGLSAISALLREKPDVAVVFNAGNAPFLPLLKAAGLPTAIHVDGLESRRAKWRGVGARYYRWAEGASVRWATEVIADASAVAEHVSRVHRRKPRVISYGAALIEPGSDRLAELQVTPLQYLIVVARLEPENHVLDIVQAFSASAQTNELVVVGSAPYAQSYIEKIMQRVRSDERIRFLGPIYDQQLLDQLYANATVYVHGHSVGGTNPSLLRAMGAGTPVAAFDVEFNREVTADQAFFWSDVQQLTTIFNELQSGDLANVLEFMAERNRSRIAEHYQWDLVTDQYEEMLLNLAARVP